MTPEEMDQVRPRLVAFAAEMLGGLARSDQRATGELYLRGLMLEGKRKSMQPMAARHGVDHQQLQQFLTSSTWDHVEVRARLARWADDVIDPDAYVLDDTGFPRAGRTRRAWRGCIPAGWARSETARSGSACTRSPTGRRRRSISPGLSPCMID
jgi:SRSO17 transposase